MLKKQLELLLNKQTNFALLDVEKTYAKKNTLISDEAVVEMTTLHFDVIERCDKESEELLAEETETFLTKPVQYVKEQPKEFIYVVSDRLEVIRVDTIALEFDEMFGVYSALFGLKLQKKYGEFLHSYFTTHLQNEKMPYSIAFSGQEGLWEVNLALNAIDGFTEQLSLAEVFTLVYRFVFGLLEELEETI